MDQGKQIRILKELPKVLQTRKSYRKLIEKLTAEHVHFRWLTLENLSFLWKGKKILIKTIEQMKEIFGSGGKEARGRTNKPKWRLSFYFVKLMGLTSLKNTRSFFIG